MAELEIHHEVEGADPLGRKIGVLASILAVLLGIVTIVSHRAHTDAVLFKSDANDKWSFYQAKKIKFHSLELGRGFVECHAGPRPQADATLARYEKEKKRYTKESDDAQEDARRMDEKAGHVEDQALRFDFGRRAARDRARADLVVFHREVELFPIVGVISALIGIGMALSGYLL